MKARVFPKLDIPDDLNELDKFIGHYDTVQEQIEFLKYCKMELELYYEPRFEEEIDAMDIKEYDDWNKILDKKIKFYEDILSNEDKGKAITNKEKFGLFNFNIEKIKELASRYKPEEAILYLKYILKEFDREKRENYYLFMTDEEIKYFEENIIITDPNKIHEPPDTMLMGIGAGQKLAIENFEKNINNEIKFLQDKNNLSLSEANEININDPQEFEKMLDTYLEYGKECYLATWKDEFQLLTFEKKMIERYGLKAKGYTVHLYKYIAKKTNPIEFIGCDYDQLRKNFDKIKIKNEIDRIDGYITEIEKLSYHTEDDISANNIPEGELEKFEEWQCYYIEKIKDKALAEWINCLRKNRPGIWDYKYGEYYQVDFKRVTEFALKEFISYRDRLENLQNSAEVKTIIKNTDKTEKQLKSFGRGELQEALEPIAKEFNLIIGESAPQKKVRLITKKLIAQGWDANEPSVGEGLRKMGYVKGRRM